MRQFSQLIDALMLSRFDKDKQRVLANFYQANRENESYLQLVTSLLKNERPKAIISSKNLKLLAIETLGIPNWLLDESKHFVGDMSETIALILSPLQSEIKLEVPLNEVLKAMDELHFRVANETKEWIVEQWQNLSSAELQVFNKLATGSFRSPVKLEFFSETEIHRVPIELKVVLLYAERGRVGGRNGFTEFTMGVGSGESWVTFAKVTALLPELERESIERWIVENTQEKFGPVHRLPATQVFTVECFAITTSKRNKSGYRVAEATLKSWENGWPLEQVATIETLREILPKH